MTKEVVAENKICPGRKGIKFIKSSSDIKAATPFECITSEQSSDMMNALVSGGLQVEEQALCKKVEIIQITLFSLEKTNSGNYAQWKEQI